MTHPSCGNVFQIPTRILRRAEKKAGDIFHAGHGFDKTVVGLVVQLEAAIFHRTFD
jgi:hypothetical protein